MTAEDLSLLRLLASPAGQEALHEAMAVRPDEQDFLQVFQRLSRLFPLALARAAVEQAILRRRAAAKFSAAEKMYFSGEALEQATSEPAAIHRAQRFAGSSLIFDCGCGLGGDALALARAAPVVAVDRSLGRLFLVRLNASALGLEDRIHPVCADVARRAWRIPREAAAFFDPSRRREGRRVHSVSRYEPPLDLILETCSGLRGFAVKVSPGVDWAEVAHLNSEIEFVSVDGELKETVLWFGVFKTVRRRATVLPGPHTLTAEREPDLAVSRPLDYLYEPDPAVMRAGLVRTLGAQMGAFLLDRTIGYLTAERLQSTPLARSYRVLEAMPFQLKRLRARLREHDAGTITVKKRGSAIEPETLIRRLGLHGQQPVTVVLTRVMDKPYALIVEPTGIVSQNG